MAVPSEQLTEEDRQDLLERLQRIEGQISGITRMVENDAECEEIARQITASRRGLERLFVRMVACAIRKEVRKSTGEESLSSVTEQLLDVLDRYY